MASSIVVARQHAVAKGVTRARPESLLTGVEVPSVLVQRTPQAVRHRSLDGILREDIPVPLAIAGRPLFPFLRLVFELINSRGEPAPGEAKGIYHALKVVAVAFGLGHCAKLLRTLRSSTLEAI